MSLTFYLRKFLTELEVSKDSIFTCPVSKQREYLEHFTPPQDLLERSYFQYKCQMFFYPLWFSVFLNLISFPILFFYFFKGNDDILYENVDAVFFSDGKKESIIPVSLRNGYKVWKVIVKKGERLNISDKKYLLKVFRRYKFSWYFLLKSLIKIRFYRYVIDSNSPRAIVVCNEYSFTSSLLTDFCSYNGIRHVNVMHGESLYYIRDSFFSYKECYVWNKEYRTLFINLRADKKQFRIEIPPLLSFNNKQSNIVKQFDFTYYLGSERGKTLSRIVSVLLSLSKFNYRVAIRLHPRYTSLTDLNLISKNIEIELPEKLTIEESLMRTNNAISLYSTVLNQAFYNNVGVVIDDLTQTERYKKLKGLGYVMLNLEHKLLSEIVSENRRPN